MDFFFDVHPHPRLYGTFPRVIGHYANKLKLFSLQECVRKMTSLPASFFNLSKRGVIKKSYFADIVILDVDNIEDLADYVKPKQLSKGISFVIVNGKIVFENGKCTDQRPGRVLKRDVE